MTTPHHTQDDTRSLDNRITPWVVFALVIVVAAAALWMMVNRGDNDETALDVSAAESEQGTEAEAGTNGEGTASDGRPGTIAAGGATVYPLQSGLTVGDYQGHDVVAADVPVESVVDGAGFWVGTSEEDRVFVVADELSDVEAGTTVSFTGVVRDHGTTFPDKIGVEGKEGAQRLRELKGHVKAEDVAVS